MSYTNAFNDNNVQSRENEVIEFLKRCQLEQYANVFIEEGFDTMEAVNEIREEDFIALNVKRGHRRLIQREIALLNGIPIHRPLLVGPIPHLPPIKPFYYKHVHKKDTGEENSSGYGSVQSSSPFSFITTDSNTTKETANSGKTSFDEEDEENSDQSMKNKYTRKYKRHPKPDINAPIKPPSAYVMFSNEARAQLKDQSLSFSDIAKIVGDQWKNLGSREKKIYERNAMRAKDEYLDALEKYKQTKKYRDYQLYLTDFKSKQHEENKRITRQRKRLKRDSLTSSSGNTADCSSNGNSSGSSLSYNNNSKESNMDCFSESFTSDSYKPSSISSPQQSFL